MECGTYWIELYAKIKIVGGLVAVSMALVVFAVIFVPLVIRYYRKK